MVGAGDKRRERTLQPGCSIAEDVPDGRVLYQVMAWGQGVAGQPYRIGFGCSFNVKGFCCQPAQKMGLRSIFQSSNLPCLLLYF